MKVVILAGGYGTRFSEETDRKPKPMIAIGGKPILWHIMKTYSHYGFNEFIICLGYKGYVIKEYFYNYYLHQSDVTLDLRSNSLDIHNNTAEPWKITMVETGLNTMTGGRVKRIEKYIDGEDFFLTYGDGVSDVNIAESLAFYKQSNALLTMTVVQPEGRFGSVDINEQNEINSFIEKPKGDGAWVNAGFFVCNKKILDYIDDDKSVLEKEPIETLANQGHLHAYKHSGFWRPMDTLRDNILLNDLWNAEKAPWAVWNG